MAKTTIYTIENLVGVQLYDGKTNEKSPSYMKNMVVKEGITKKRNGWKTLYNFRGYSYQPYSINGIYEYKGKDKSCLLIHADNYLYECDYDLKNINPVPLENGISLKNKRSTGQMYAGVLWLGGMGELLIYDGDLVKRAAESQLAYIPTTAIGICDTRQGVEYEKRDEPNLITGKRINKLRGCKNSDKNHKFLLDSKAVYGKPFKLTVTFRVKKSEEVADDYTTDYIGTTSGGEEVNDVVKLQFYTDSLHADLIKPLSLPVDAYGNTINIKDVDFSCKVTNGDELYLNFDAPSYQKGTDNISATYFAQGKDSTELKGVETMAQITLKKGGCVMVMACGGSKLYSAQEKDGFIHFPSDGGVTIGGETEKVTAVLPMAQSTVAVYKQDSFYRLGIDLEDSIKYEVYPSSDQRGSINSFVAKRFGYDCLCYNREGVFKIGDGDSQEYINTRLYMCSSPVRRELVEFSLEEAEGACACVHNETYYLFIGNRAYITQGGTQEYDWWIFDNCPATYAVSINQTLYMGRENGDVAIFDNDYVDRHDYILTEKENDFVLHGTSPATVSFNYAIDVGQGDKISLPPHHLLVGNCQYIAKTNEFKVPSIYFLDGEGNADLFEGQEVLLIDKDGYQVYEGKILGSNPSEMTIFCGNLGLGANTTVSLYAKKDENTEYTLKMVGGIMSLYLGEKPATIHNTDVEKIIIRRKTEIECELYTPVIDLGQKREKTLCGIVLTPSVDTRCDLRIGYETRKSSFSKKLTIGSYMDFGSTDFRDFSFNPRFKKSIKINCLERNFDYIRLWLYSDSGRELGIDSISLIYS